MTKCFICQQRSPRPMIDDICDDCEPLWLDSLRYKVSRAVVPDISAKQTKKQVAEEQKK